MADDLPTLLDRMVKDSRTLRDLIPHTDGVESEMARQVSTYLYSLWQSYYSAQSGERHKC